MRGIFRMDALPAQALTTGLISATQPDSGAAIQLAPAITAQQLLQSPTDAWITNGGGPTLPRKLDANQIRAVTITACNGMPRFREIYDVKQLRDVSDYLIRKVEAAN